MKGCIWMRSFLTRLWDAWLIGLLVEVGPAGYMAAQEPGPNLSCPAPQGPSPTEIPNPPVPTASSGIGWPFENGYHGSTHMPSQHSEPPGLDETWENAVGHQEAYRNGLDPPFDLGHLPY